MHRFDALRTASPVSPSTSPRTSNPSSTSLPKTPTPFSMLFSADIPLKNAWYVWSTSKPKPPTNPQNNNPSQVSPNNYEQAMVPVARFDTVNTFCAIYSRLSRPGTPHPIPVQNDLHVFREGIKPLWEDSNNQGGGKLVLRLGKGLSARLWEHLLIGLLDHESPLYRSMTNKTVPVANPMDICGVVLSVRYQEDIISVWCKHGTEAAAEGLRQSLLRMLCLPSNTVFEYKAHDLSLKDRSSYRNTSKYRP